LSRPAMTTMHPRSRERSVSGARVTAPGRTERGGTWYDGGSWNEMS
jgi:hypothetical protein